MSSLRGSSSFAVLNIINTHFSRLPLLDIAAHLDALASTVIVKAAKLLWGACAPPRTTWVSHEFGYGYQSI